MNEGSLSSVRSQHLMRACVEAIPSYLSVDEASRWLFEKGRESAPVIDDEGTLLGVFRISQCLRARLRALAGCSATLQSSVGQQVHREVAYVRWGASILEIALNLEQIRGVGLPVVDARGRLLGMIYEEDIAVLLRDGGTRSVARASGCCSSPRAARQPLLSVAP